MLDYLEGPCQFHTNELNDSIWLRTEVQGYKSSMKMESHSTVAEAVVHQNNPFVSRRVSLQSPILVLDVL